MVSWGPKPGNKQDGRPRTPGNWGVPRAGLDLRVQGSVCATDPYALAKQARAQTAPPQYAAEEEDWNDIVPPQKTARDRARPAWTPGGQHFSAMAALPETNHPRPLHEPTYMPATQGGTQRAPRTVGQLEHCLREWTWKHRELHESRRTTLGRALMLASGFDKRLLRSANSPEANRASDTTASGGWRSARGSTLHRRASFNTETNPTLPSMASVQAASPAWEGKDIRELSSAERWALKRHQAIAKAHEQRGSIPALTAGILDPFSPTPMSTAFTESTGVWGAPPPKRMSQHAELAASRAASQGQENLSQAAQDKAALKDLALTRAQLLAAWSRLLAAERKQPGQAPPCLELELTEAEADALIFVHGRRKAEWASPWSGVGDGTVAVGDVLLVAKLVEAVLTDPSHTLNQQKVVHGAPRAGAQLEGRILVPPCRTPLYAPSAFDFQAAAARSAQQPSARLELEAVHGYAGFDNTCPNLFYAHDGSIVYYTAGVGVVCAPPTSTRSPGQASAPGQRHTDQSPRAPAAAGSAIAQHAKQHATDLPRRGPNTAAPAAQRGGAANRLHADQQPIIFYNDGQLSHPSALPVGVHGKPHHRDGGERQDQDVDHDHLQSGVIAVLDHGGLDDIHASESGTSVAASYAPVNSLLNNLTLERHLREATDRYASSAVPLAPNSPRAGYASSAVPLAPNSPGAGDSAANKRLGDPVSAAAGYAAANEELVNLGSTFNGSAATGTLTANIRSAAATTAQSAPARSSGSGHAVLENYGASTPPTGASKPLAGIGSGQKSAQETGPHCATTPKSAAVIADPLSAAALAAHGSANRSDLGAGILGDPEAASGRYVQLAAARQATASGGQRYANLEETFPGTDCGGAIETAIKEAHERPEGALIDAGPSPASSGTPNPRPTAAAALLPAESGPARTITAGPAKPGDQPASSQAPAAVPPGDALQHPPFDPNGTATVRASLRKSAGLDPEEPAATTAAASATTPNATVVGTSPVKGSARDAGDQPDRGSGPPAAATTGSSGHRPATAKASAAAGFDGEFDTSECLAGEAEECVRLAVNFVSPTAEGRYSNLEATFDGEASGRDKPGMHASQRPAVHAGRHAGPAAARIVGGEFATLEDSLDEPMQRSLHDDNQALPAGQAGHHAVPPAALNNTAVATLRDPDFRRSLHHDDQPVRSSAAFEPDGPHFDIDNPTAVSAGAHQCSSAALDNCHDFYSPAAMQSEIIPGTHKQPNAIAATSATAAGKASAAAQHAKHAQHAKRTAQRLECIDCPLQQRFFQAHDNDITSLALHPNGRLVATGQVGAKPCVAIWTLDGCKEQRCLYHEEGSRGITALAFCGGKGRWLTTVATDNQHTVRVWDWSVGRVVAQGPGYQGAPPQVYGAVWDQDLDQGEARFLTFGVKHLKQWDRTTDPRNSYAGRICAWSGAEPQTVLCAAFLPAGMDGRLAYFARMRRGVTVPRRAQFEGVIATGHPNGAVYFWRERAVIATLQSYQLPAKVNLLQESKPEGSQGVRCLRVFKHRRGAALPSDLEASRRLSNPGGASAALMPASPCQPGTSEPMPDRWFIVSGGGDGHIRFWDLGPEDSLAAKMQGGGAASARRGVMRIAPLTVPGAGEGVSAAIRSLDVRPDGTAVLVGTHGCDVWELALDLDQDQTPQVDPDLDGAEDSELGIFADGQGPAASRAAAVTIPTTTAAVAIPTAAVATPTPTAAVAIPTTTMAGTIPTTTEAVTIPTTTAATTTLADVAAEVPNAGAGAGPLPVSSSASHGQGASAAASILQQNLPPIPPHGAQTGTTGSKPAPAHPPGSANPHIGTASHAAASSSSTQAEQAAAERRASGNQAGPNPLAAVTAAAAAAKLPKRLVCGHSGNLYAVAVHPSNPDVYVTACDDNEVLVWHARQRHPLGLPIYASAAARAVAFAEPHGHHIAVGLEDGALEVYDRKRRRIMHTRRCQHEISEVKYAPCGNVLATASHDCVIDLYNVGKGYQCYARCRGHSATVAHLDFSTDSRILQSTCHANEIMYWDVLTGRQLAQCQRDRKWRTWTCPFGFPVLGIWGDTAAVSGTDINAVCRDPQERLLVSADDFGHLSLFNWPCIVATAGSRIYGGHSAHVMGVRFNADGSRVISVGGHDRSVFQWRVVQTDDCLDTEINSLRNDGPALAPVHMGRVYSTTATAGLPSSGSQGIAATAAESAAQHAGVSVRDEAGSRDTLLESPGSALPLPKGSTVDPQVLQRTSVAEQLMNRQKTPSAAGYVKARLAQMQSHLNCELEKLRLTDGGSKGTAQPVVAPPGKVWGPANAKGTIFGWVDPPAQG